MQRLRIYNAEHKHIPRICEIENAVFDDAWSHQSFAELMSGDKCHFYLAEVDGVIAGYVGIMVVLDEFHLLNFAVLPEYQSQGIGGELMTEILLLAKKADVQGITLECRASNHRAISFYESIGFDLVGHRKGYYENKEDAAIMWHRMDSITITLAIETSCDETAVSVLIGGRNMLSNVVYSQVDLHKIYGGVVPEIASRNHLDTIAEAVDLALEQAGVGLENLDLIAVTNGPGLVGALLVGVAYAKALSYSLGIDLIGVNHIEGHIASNYISHLKLKPPFLALVVSGGHTQLIEVRTYTEMKIIGESGDDAVGEAYDKVARTLGLGYPGGPLVEELAAEGMDCLDFPRPMLHSGDLNFSFSGLKSAVLNHINSCNMKGEDLNIPDICASFQAAVVDILRAKCKSALESTGLSILAISGGVSANKAVLGALQFEGVRTYAPSASLCGDNAGMIASAGYYHYISGQKSDLKLNADPSLRAGETYLKS